ncbi:Fic family protein [Luteibacter sp. dw_328]|uniref:Fic family protein n=1 Tax=Luteibacter sp. dw_328 TaxID=2719796 RepID=UPI001BD4A3BE
MTALNDILKNEVLGVMSHLARAGLAAIAVSELAEQTGISASTARRLLAQLTQSGDVIVLGKGRATRYSLANGTVTGTAGGEAARTSASRWQTRAIPWSPESVALLQKLEAPLHTRQPIAYRRELLDDYRPGVDALLPKVIVEDLLARGRLPDQQPAGTYARKVLEQLLVELSWSSSKLEGNTYSLLDTKHLFQQGSEGSDTDTLMLLNHKRAIEYLVAEAPLRGLVVSTVRNIHTLLMGELLDDDQLGAIRETPVYIAGTTFVPLQIAQLVEELLVKIVDKARDIPNPVEAAFFLWVQIAYLQPFVDGNKRTSRISANIPLTLYNCAPLAFMDVDRSDYALAMMGVYEFNDVSAAIDLFVWTYERSILRYKAVIQSTGAPNPLVIRFRDALTSAVGRIVADGQSFGDAVKAQGLNAEDEAQFVKMLSERLNSLQPYNNARYRLSEEATVRWIAAGRPR